MSLGRNAAQGSTPPRSAVGGWVVVSVGSWPRLAALARRAGLGAAAGVLYAAGDVATKAAVHGGASARLRACPARCHGLAFVALQLGFQRGGALATAGIATLLTNALPIAAGTLVFAEGLGSGPALRAARLRLPVVGSDPAGAETGARGAEIALSGRPGTL